jgi:hypothetical protein
MTYFIIIIAIIIIIIIIIIIAIIVVVFLDSTHIFCLAERQGGAAHPGRALLSFTFKSSPVCRLNNPLTVHIPIHNVM